MKNNARCFILSDGNYEEEISYAELQARRVNNPVYATKRFIRLHGMLMEVTEADYRSFYRDKRRQQYIDEEASFHGTFSYNAYDSDELSGEELIQDTASPVDEQVAGKLCLEDMLRCFGRLDEADRKLLTALYVDGTSERELARRLETPRMTLNYHTDKALERLRDLVKINKV